MLEDMEITVDNGLYQEFSQLCAEIGITPECCLKRMFSWMSEDPAAMAYIREAAAEQREAVEN